MSISASNQFITSQLQIQTCLLCKSRDEPFKYFPDAIWLNIKRFQERMLEHRCRVFFPGCKVISAGSLSKSPSPMPSLQHWVPAEQCLVQTQHLQHALLPQGLVPAAQAVLRCLFPLCAWAPGREGPRLCQRPGSAVQRGLRNSQASRVHTHAPLGGFVVKCQQ